MMTVFFSIIIPHKNSTKLLQYCLDSIPLRDDVQVIVVDDNSDSGIVDFNQFPQWKGNHYECYFTKEGCGAGYARNIGLKHAKGEWVIFADADDFFTDKANAAFDIVLQSTSDIVYFRPHAVVLSDRKTPSARADYYNSLIDDYLNSGDEATLRNKFEVPWSKFIRLSLIKRNKICFDEIPYANDIYFSTKIGCVANKVSVSNDCYYYVTESEHSLTSNYGKKEKEYRSRTFGLFHSNVVSAKYKYIDLKIIIDQLRKWQNSDHLLFVMGLESMRKEGFCLFGVVQQVVANRNVFLKTKLIGKTSFLIITYILHKYFCSRKKNTGALSISLQ